MLPALPSGEAKFLRSLLHEKRVRDAERLFVLESPKAIFELLDMRPRQVRSLTVSSAFLDTADPDVLARIEKSRVPVYTSKASLIRNLADVETPPGIMAVVRQPSGDVDRIFRRPTVFGVYGESIQDPANVGAIIRTAAAFDADAVWFTPDSADTFSPKVVRATAGALLSLPVFRIDHAGPLVTEQCALLAAQVASPATRPLHTISGVQARSILCFGNEGRGLSQTTLQQATIRFHIAISASVESLNVAASAAIALFYFRRLSSPV